MKSLGGFWVEDFVDELKNIVVESCWEKVGEMLKGDVMCVRGVGGEFLYLVIYGREMRVWK
ncbi:hypothetical protein, partial [Bacillus velezensis]|uniref:hypothetical protein n=1 Tax=Bacillus velezensis TaxID=492670 RepID=UPI001C92DEFA